MTQPLTRRAPRTRRAHARARRALPAALLLAALATPLTWPVSGASFTASTAITGNAFNAATVFGTQLLGNPGFETGTAAPWTVTTASEISNSATEPPHSGQWDAWLAPVALSPQLLSQAVTLPGSLNTATLSFYLHTDFKGMSGTGTMTVQLLNTSGTVLTTLATINATNSSGYTQYTYDVSSYAGQTLTLKFNATAIGLRQPNFVIDDTALTVS